MKLLCTTANNITHWSVFFTISTNYRPKQIYLFHNHKDFPEFEDYSTKQVYSPDKFPLQNSLIFIILRKKEQRRKDFLFAKRVVFSWLKLQYLVSELGFGIILDLQQHIPIWRVVNRFQLGVLTFWCVYISRKPVWVNIGFCVLFLHNW